MCGGCGVFSLVYWLLFPRVAQLITLLNEFHARICRLEFAKYDMEFEVKKKDFEVHGPSSSVSLSQSLILSLWSSYSALSALSSSFLTFLLLHSLCNFPVDLELHSFATHFDWINSHTKLESRFFFLQCKFSFLQLIFVRMAHRLTDIHNLTTLLWRSIFSCSLWAFDSRQ
jgi:hypothetical protein